MGEYSTRLNHSHRHEQVWEHIQLAPGKCASQKGEVEGKGSLLVQPALRKAGKRRFTQQIN